MQVGRTKFLRILDRNGRFEIGWYILSREGFFSKGLMIAVFKSGGTTQEAREVSMVLAIVRTRTSRFSYSSFEGMGSRSHELGAVF